MIYENFVSTVMLLTAFRSNRFLNFARAHALLGSSPNDADIASLTSVMTATRFFADIPRSEDQDNLPLRCLEAADLSTGWSWTGQALPCDQESVRVFHLAR